MRQALRIIGVAILTAAALLGVVNIGYAMGTGSAPALISSRLAWTGLVVGFVLFVFSFPLRMYISLDRRWVFLLMAIAVLIPIVSEMRFPERPTPLSRNVFKAIEELPEGSRILIAMDYDPGSAPELQPMATALVYHCSRKRHKMYFMALWPVGKQMIDNTIDTVIKQDPRFADLEYGVDYVNLGFKTGNEGVIKAVVSDLRSMYREDARGRSLDEHPMTRDLRDIKNMDLIINVSAGYPGTKEWIQYAAGPYGIPIVAGCTGVQAPLLYPYIPRQMQGLLGAIKGAAEYEAAVANKYPDYAEHERYQEGIRRMGPQLVAHCLILALILFGNIVYFATRPRRRRRLA